ncbi:hypothetical protein HY086_06990 [Candidatus Gottesmanbacteria bacterium]|nr:hypothetical protein [Candidatus Gottesmanbacteria bacterium]
MNKQLIADQLEQFGLDEVEVVVYLHLLQNGPKTPLDLSRETNVNRSRIYRYLDRLKHKKLIEEVKVGRGISLKAASPSNLELLIHERERELTEQKSSLPTLLRELTRMPTELEKVFEVKYYHGPEGLKQLMWNHLSANKEILAFSYRNKNDTVGKTFAERIREEQARKKILLYEIENETDQGDYWYTDVKEWQKHYRSRYIDPKILEIKQYIAIFNNTVSIANWIDNEPVGIEIVNAVYASTQRQMFWKFWEIAGKSVLPKKKPGKASV